MVAFIILFFTSYNVSSAPRIYTARACGLRQAAAAGRAALASIPCRPLGGLEETAPHLAARQTIPLLHYPHDDNVRRARHLVEHKAGSPKLHNRSRSLAGVLPRWCTRCLALQARLLRWQSVIVTGDTRRLAYLGFGQPVVQDLEDALSMRLRFVDSPRHRSLLSLPSPAGRSRKA